MITSCQPTIILTQEEKKILEYKELANKIFKPFGYETLVIWEKELKDIELLKMKIEKFGEHNEKSE